MNHRREINKLEKNVNGIFLDAILKPINFIRGYLGIINSKMNGDYSETLDFKESQVSLAEKKAEIYFNKLGINLNEEIKSSVNVLGLPPETCARLYELSKKAQHKKKGYGPRRRSL